MLLVSSGCSDRLTARAVPAVVDTTTKACSAVKVEDYTVMVARCTSATMR